MILITCNKNTTKSGLYFNKLTNLYQIPCDTREPHQGIYKPDRGLEYSSISYLLPKSNLLFNILSSTTKLSINLQHEDRKFRIINKLRNSISQFSSIFGVWVWKSVKNYRLYWVYIFFLIFFSVFWLPSWLLGSPFQRNMVADMEEVIMEVTTEDTTWPL